MNEHKIDGDIASQIDQFSGVAAHIASVVAYYAKSLEEQGIGTSLTAILTRDFHERVWDALLKAVSTDDK